MMALNALIRIKTAAVKLANSSRSLLDQIFRDEGKVDVKNVESLKLREHGKKGKKGGGKKGEKGNSAQGNQDAKDEAEKRQKEEEERLKNWNEDWERKLKAQEILDDVPCCSAQGLILKPRTQSNIWIKVTKDKNIQDVQMAFMHVPVPKPKPPPLPKLVVKFGKESSSEVERPKDGNKKGKGNKKKKKDKK